MLPRLLIIGGVLLVLLFGAMIYAASTGPTTIPAGDVANALLQYAGIDRGVDAHSTDLPDRDHCPAARSDGRGAGRRGAGLRGRDDAGARSATRWPIRASSG